MAILKVWQTIRRGLGCMAVMMMASPLFAATWFPLGPYGGDARSFAADPHNSQHLYLGTATGWVYESTDGGTAWKRLSRVGKRDDIVIAHILLDALDAKHVIVGAYALDHPDGGLYESRDGGLTWYSQAQMRGQSVRALTASPSDPKLMVAGTLQGVYRTRDAGVHWQLISPEGSMEIHEVESIAIDPVDPNVIYAGTWHLPWKTTDGGVSWANIGVKQGFIDDSDVFSIIVDPQKPQTVYASACSGIYKSVNAGLRFDRVRKDQLGMDHAALRTRKLLQNPVRPQIVFAGTTQGLWRTTDDAATWSRLTAPDVIVNDIYIDSKNDQHMLLATDRSGVLVSEDGGVSFKASNSGFTTRQVTSFASDPHRAATIYVGVVNDKNSGGVFKSTDGGVRWQQESNALNGRDVFSLASTDGGTLLAGTGHGIFRLEEGVWSESGTLSFPLAADVPVVPKVVAPKRGLPGKPVAKAKTPPPPPPSLDAAVYALAATGDAVYAGTSAGLIKGTSDGKLWTEITTLQMPEPRYVAAQKSIVLVGNLRQMAVSVDDGKSWKSLGLPEPLTQISSIAVDEMGNLWVGGREGVLYSADDGVSWKPVHNLYVTQVTGLYFDPVGHQLMVTSNSNTVTFAAHLPDFKVSYWDSGWELRFVRPVGDHMVGATLFDGVVVQPIMVESKMADAK
jgi:photosystem II stability/assembly factor-like uncharacterized protein